MAILMPSPFLLAGKPWRPEVSQLAAESTVIVIGTVTSIEPSLVTDAMGHPCSIAEVKVRETLKGDPVQSLRVAMPAEPRYDQTGTPILASTAYRYELKAAEHSYLLFLIKPGIENAAYYVPAGSGSGIVDLNKKDDGSRELERLRAHLNLPASEPHTEASRYRFELVCIPGSQPVEWLFVIASTGFKTVDALKQAIAKLPKGSVLEMQKRGHRSPSEPLFSSEPEIEALTQYARSYEVNIIQVPGK
ncbi:MAG: hypothetical protein JWL90_2 [Chthoniobacteraceae bacterium]|nr:hypothetical protein [Chthoniobacteraceae bacterium]